MDRRERNTLPPPISSDYLHSGKFKNLPFIVKSKIYILKKFTLLDIPDFKQLKPNSSLSGCNFRIKTK